MPYSPSIEIEGLSGARHPVLLGAPLLSESPAADKNAKR